MATADNFLRSNAKRLVAAFIAVGVSIAMVRSERLDDVGRDLDVDGRFALTRSTLPELADTAAVGRTSRPVHPDIGRIPAFVGSIGAAAALHDLDRNGLPDDVCFVETRTNRAMVAPVPGTGDRYAPFALDHANGGAVTALRPFDYIMGCLPADFDEDGDTDLLLHYAGRPPVLFTAHPDAAAGRDPLRLQPSQFVPAEIVPGGSPWTTPAATVADVDGDGHLDLVLVNYFAETGAIYDESGAGSVAMPDSFSRAYNGGGLRIFTTKPSTNGQSPAFVEVRDGLPAIARTGWGLAIGAQDLDGDLLPEIYIANDFGPDRLLWNRSTAGQVRFSLLEGEPGFAVPQSKVLGHDSFKGMGIDFGDLNGDDIPDLYVSNITAERAAQESQLIFLSTGARDVMANGIAPYRDGSEALGVARSGWAWDAKLEDFDNDGVLEALQATGFIKGTTTRWPELQELAVANDRLISRGRLTWPTLGVNDDLSGGDQNPFFVRVNGRYVDIAARIGFREQHVSRGLALADVDGDGRIDVAVANMWGPSSFYRNTGTRTGAFLGLHLRLAAGTDVATTAIRDGHVVWDVPSRAAVGASATITLPDGRRVTRQVDGGNGHSGKRSPDLLFGLGTINGPVHVDLKWRTATGKIRSESHTLRPGWHSILVGGSEGSGS